MEMIFPGMDPYLENPLAWSALHSRFITYVADELAPQLGSRYATSVNERVYVEGANREFLPDAHLSSKRPPGDSPDGNKALIQGDVGIELVVPEIEVKEWFVEILDLQTKGKVVTVIEAISPSNKRAGPGRRSYVKKQREVLHSQTHLVEIDLLRKGKHVAAVPEWLLGELEPYDYFVSVNRAIGDRRRFRVYPIRLREPLPTVLIPVSGEDPDVRLNVRLALAKAYSLGNLRTRLPYRKPCSPRLSRQDQAWADDLLRAAGVK